jgi:hypothetical protein
MTPLSTCEWERCVVEVDDARRRVRPQLQECSRYIADIFSGGIGGS